MYKEFTRGTYERQPNFLLQSSSVVDNLGSRRLLCIQDPRYDIPSMHRVTRTAATAAARLRERNTSASGRAILKTFRSTTDIY